MNKPLIMILFAALCAAQLAVPASMIIRLNSTAAKGTVYRFRTAPVDPYDAFRGRYVALAFEQTTVPIPEGQHLQENTSVYVTLEVDSEGFARLDSVELKSPEQGDFIKTRVLWVNGDRVSVYLPFDRYYMPEDVAPLAERAYNLRSRGAAPAYAEVSVYKGHAVLKGLYLDDMTIEEYLRREAKDNP